MLSVSLIIDKPVLCLYECEFAGKVCDVWFDKKLEKVIGLLVSTNCEITDERLLLPFKNIENFGDDVITVKNRGAFKNQVDFPNLYMENNPRGADVFYTSGKRISFLSDIIFNQNGAVSNLILENGQSIVQNRILKFSLTTILINDSETPIKLFAPKKTSVPKNKSNVSVEVFDGEADPDLIEEKYFDSFISDSLSENRNSSYENYGSEINSSNNSNGESGYAFQIPVNTFDASPGSAITEQTEYENNEEISTGITGYESDSFNSKNLNSDNFEIETIQKNYGCILNKKTKFTIRLNGFIVKKGTLVDASLIKKVQKVNGLKTLIISVLTNIDSQLY